jgi:Predicted dehydrogenases and related proteins
MPVVAPLRFVLFGAGFWARYQLAAWGEHADAARCVGVCDVDAAKAASLAAASGVPSFTDPAEALDVLRPDFADIVTPVETHAPLARLCAERGVAAVCQKPLAPTIEEAETLVADVGESGATLLVHENWRWQRPLRAAGELLRDGAVGTPFRARLTFACSFPVFDNQPFLATLDRFILTDIGSHVLDTARFLFGEASSLYATTARVNPAIRGEDVATVMMTMGDAATTVTCEMSYASRTEHERFPQTYLFVEGDGGSLEVGPDYLLRLTTRSRGTWDAPVTEVRRVPPPRYTWADPAYDLVMSSMVPCQADLLKHLRGDGTAETIAADNLRTVRLVFAAYDSAQSGKVVTID